MVTIVKADGTKELFSEEKLRASIHRAGIPDSIQNLVVDHIKEKLYETIPTAEIYRHITEFLGKAAPFSKAKYTLKQSLMALGPTGYPFEDFMAKVLQTQGYATTVRNILRGKCITHEVDIIATKGTHKVMVEAKFHNMPGTKTNVHVAMYTKARFNDLLDKNNLNEAWLVTNTKITTDAIAYAVCMGMKVISWNYPEGDSLRDIIERSGLSPITTLTTLSSSHKKQLINQDVVLTKDLCSDPLSLQRIKLSQKNHKQVLSEAEFISTGAVPA